MSNKKQMLIAVAFVLVITAITLLLHHLFPGGSRTQNIENEMSVLADEFAVLSVRAHQSWQAQTQQGSPPPRVILKVTSPEGAVDNRVVKMHYRGYPWFDDSNTGCKKLWRAMLGKDLYLGTVSVKTYFYDDREMASGGKSDACRFIVRTGSGFDYYVVDGSVEKF